VFDNPVIGRIEIVPYDFQFNPPLVRNPHPGVGHQGDIKLISTCDAVHLGFDWARISIDKNVQQLKILIPTMSGSAGRNVPRS
jgi:hypothetical protein